MDLLPFLLAIFAALVIIGGLIWYIIRLQRTPKKRSRRQRPSSRRPLDRITAATEKNLAKAETMEEVFAAGREGLKRLKRQIKAPKTPKRKEK